MDGDTETLLFIAIAAAAVYWFGIRNNQDGMGESASGRQPMISEIYRQNVEDPHPLPNDPQNRVVFAAPAGVSARQKSPPPAGAVS